MKVYLAGGMRGEWRSYFPDRTGVIYFNPCDPGFGEPDKYTTYDLKCVENCDVLFGYLEKDNPSGLGLFLEIGYAKALGKIIVFVDEKNDHYTQIARQCADIICDNLDDAIITVSKFSYLMPW